MIKTTNIAILLIAIFTQASCGNSNEKYINDISSSFGNLLTKGTKKKDLIYYLEKMNYKYSNKTQRNCSNNTHKLTTPPCIKGSYIHTRIEIQKNINPIKSGAHIYLLFDESNTLKKHEIRVSHNFL